MMQHNVFTIPAGIPFAKALAQHVLSHYANSTDKISDVLILLPTRRACRTVQEAFLHQNNGKPMMLPQLQALGDIDEEELSLSIPTHMKDAQSGNILNLSPALSSMTRQILLARAIIQHEDFPHGFDQALTLAKALSHLMDQIHTENLDIRDLSKIVPEDFASHWQVTLDFLTILSETWPLILDNLNMMDAAQRRNTLINALSNFWKQTRPNSHIIAAGTTGSIPATASLLNTIANLPNGQIILPGLDTHCDDESWRNLNESHPQYGLKHLLDYMHIERKDVQLWPTTLPDHTTSQARRVLVSETMRPAETTKYWQNLARNDTPDTQSKQQQYRAALDHLNLFECDDPFEEAKTIATLMRETLEHPDKTAALITPDRQLAKRVITACKRWNITLDDSAGIPLTQTKIGTFLSLSINTCEKALSPVSLLSLLKHPLTHKDLQNIVPLLETHLLRGLKPPPGIAGLITQLQKNDQVSEPTRSTIENFIATLETIFAPLLKTISGSEDTDFKHILKSHITLCEKLHTGFQTSAEPQNSSLWQDEDGEAAALLFSELLQEANNIPTVSVQEYQEILKQFMSGVTLRPRFGTHPRLQILGQLEARLIDADLVILGGLNEGTWPPDPGHDPWMSRTMRKEFGLPSHERSIGLAAHDFTQGFCAPNVVITRSKMQDGAPTIPARWLQRLETVLSAIGTPIETITNHPIQNWLKTSDHTEHLEPQSRPAPQPPVSARPRRLSVTKIETWLKDPYSIYAHSILKLRPLDPLEKQADAAIRGEIIHDTLERFITEYPDTIPENAADIILGFAQEKIETDNHNQQAWHFYWPRFHKIITQYLQHETQWRNHAKPYKTEAIGQITLKPKTGEDFILTGRADRIDTYHQGCAIIDYKSGGSFSKTAMKNGETPQLPLEALILQDGGFEGIPTTDCTYLSYWVLNASGKEIALSDPHDILVDTHESLLTLIETFDQEETPYYALPRSHMIPRFNDYEHLSRVKEWGTLGDDNDDSYGEVA